MAKKWKADKPNDPVPTSDTAYLNSGFPMAECLRAEAKVMNLLRTKLKETRVEAQQVLLAMLPALKAEKKLEITEAGVRAAVKKVLDAE